MSVLAMNRVYAAECAAIEPGAPSAAGGRQLVEDRALDALDRQALLDHRIAVADRGGAVLERLDVDAHAPWGADLVLAPVQLADCCRVVVHGYRVAGDVVAEPVG